MRVSILVMVMVMAVGCAMTVDKHGLSTAAGVSNVCHNDEDGKCQIRVSSQGFSEGIVGALKQLGTAGMALLGVVMPGGGAVAAPAATVAPHTHQ